MPTTNSQELEQELLHLFASAWQDGVHYLNPQYLRRDTLFANRVLGLVESLYIRKDAVIGAIEHGIFIDPNKTSAQLINEFRQEIRQKLGLSQESNHE